jgi:hypothetical protein
MIQPPLYRFCGIALWWVGGVAASPGKHVILSVWYSIYFKQKDAIIQGFIL